jgi:hypothetical protein
MNRTVSADGELIVMLSFIEDAHVNYRMLLLPTRMSANCTMQAGSQYQLYRDAPLEQSRCAAIRHQTGRLQNSAFLMNSRFNWKNKALLHAFQEMHQYRERPARSGVGGNIDKSLI